MDRETQPSNLSSQDPSRRRLLTLMGAGGAAILASQLASNEAQAGHNGTNTMHLGETNLSPGGASSSITANVAGAPTLGLLNNNAGGSAIQVQGKAKFSTGGSGVVPAGQASVFVADTDVTSDSHISVTLVTNPMWRLLMWVERDPGVGFRVHLTPAPTRRRLETHFTYLITEPHSG
jgi:hypothetical protein